MCQGVDVGAMFNGQNLVLASSAMKAVGNVVQGNQGAKYLEYQGAQADADAQAEREMGQVRAARVRKAGAMVSKEAMAAQGASGSSVNSGSALAVREYIDKGSEQDALTELYGGQARGRSLEASAAGYRTQAGLTRASGYGAAGGSLLAGAGYVARLKQENDKWIRARNKGVASFGDQYSLDDPAYG